MTRNLKAVALALGAIFVFGAVAVSAASAAEEFHSDGPRTTLTGKTVGKTKITIGMLGTLECETAKLEGTVEGAKTDEKNYTNSSLTLKPTYGNPEPPSGCKFGENEAHVKVNDCAFVLGTKTKEGDAGFEIECAEGNKIEIDITNVCTIKVPPQKSTEVAGGVHYETDTESSLTVQWTVKNIRIEKAKTTEKQVGCALVPEGHVVTYGGTSTLDCRKDEDLAAQANPTTPTGTKDATTTNCRYE